MMREAMVADVIVIGEAHSDGFVWSQEIAILSQILARREAGCPVSLVYESARLQEPVSLAARELGYSTTECEPDLALGSEDPGKDDLWVLAKRDRRVVATCRNVCRRGHKSVVLYGAAHSGVIQSALADDGLNVVRIIVAPSARMEAITMTVLGTVNIVGRVMRYESGTYTVHSRPFAAYGCPAIDDLLDTP
jgi:hypothetical protein